LTAVRQCGDKGNKAKRWRDFRAFRRPASKRRIAAARQPRQQTKSWGRFVMKFIDTNPSARHARRLLAGASAATILLAGATAHAQTPYWLDAITIVALKTEQLAIDSLAAVSTLREQQLREIAAARPAQLFTGMPGVSTESTAQDPGLQESGRVAVIIDGARQNFARAGHNGSGSFYLEPELLSEVDVVRGPVSNIYGSGAIGGVVSFRTKDVDDILKPAETSGIATHGEIGSNRFNGLGSMFAAMRASPNADFIVGGTYRHQDAYKDGSGHLVPFSGEQVTTGLAKGTFRPADGHEVKLGAIHYEADWINRAFNTTTNVTSALRDSDVRNTTTTAKWGYDKPEDKLFNFSHGVYWNRVDVETTALYVNPAFTGFYGNVGNRAGYKIDTIGYDGHNTSRFDFGEFRHEFTVGGDIFEDDVSNFDQAGFGAGYNPSGQRRVWGGFAQLRSRYSTWLEVISALRYDNYSLDGVGAGGAAANAGGDRISPKVTVGVSPLQWLTFYGTYAEGYRAPAVTETLIAGVHPAPANFTFLPNPNLRPEVGKTKEFGINVKRDDVFMAGDRWRVKANVFRNDVDDFIDSETFCVTAFIQCWIGFNPANGPNFANWRTQYRNLSQARIEGVELESNYDRGDWFVGLNAHRLRGKDLTEGDPLGNVPVDMLAATLGMRSADRKWTAAIRWAHYGPKKRSDLPNSTEGSTDTELLNVTSSYNLVNLYLAYQPTENIIAGLSVENLLDETYRVYTHELNSPGLTVKGSLRVRFAGGPPPLAEEKPIRR
jgi:hemoglobin/transferrin/lactoferrin receptor protein